MGTLKIPLRSIRSEEGPHYHLGVKREEAVIRQATINPIHEFGYPLVIPYRAVLRSLANARKCQLKDFVKKKGINPVQSNGRSQQTPSAKVRKGKDQR